MAHINCSWRVIALFAIPIVFSTFCVAQKARFFKAEHGVAAGYIKLSTDGTYIVIAREHMGLFVLEKGQWNQNGSAIAFNPTEPKKAAYEGMENTYRGKTFLSWSSDGAAGIVIPIESTEQELDVNPKGLPDHVFFRITAKTYSTETKETYPFRYLR